MKGLIKSKGSKIWKRTKSFYIWFQKEIKGAQDHECQISIDEINTWFVESNYGFDKVPDPETERNLYRSFVHARATALKYIREYAESILPEEELELNLPTFSVQPCEDGSGDWRVMLAPARAARSQEKIDKICTSLHNRSKKVTKEMKHLERNPTLSDTQKVEAMISGVQAKTFFEVSGVLAQMGSKMQQGMAKIAEAREMSEDLCNSTGTKE